jgi:hypothetical protein
MTFSAVCTFDLPYVLVQVVLVPILEKMNKRRIA